MTGTRTHSQKNIITFSLIKLKWNFGMTHTYKPSLNSISHSIPHVFTTINDAHKHILSHYWIFNANSKIGIYIRNNRIPDVWVRFFTRFTLFHAIVFSLSIFFGLFRLLFKLERTAHIVSVIFWWPPPRSSRFSIVIALNWTFINIYKIFTSTK